MEGDWGDWTLKPERVAAEGRFTSLPTAYLTRNGCLSKESMSSI